MTDQSDATTQPATPENGDVQPEAHPAAAAHVQQPTLLLAPEDEPEPLKLEAAPAVKAVEQSSASSFLPQISDDRRLEIGTQATGFVTDLATFNVNSPEFVQKLSDVQNLAKAEIVRSGTGTNRLLQERTSSVSGSKGTSTDATTQVAKALTDLRSTVEELTPRGADQSTFTKVLSKLPFGKSIRRYFHRFETAQAQLDAIVKSLTAGQDELLKDNASLQQEKRDLWTVMQRLNEYAYLASQLDEQVTTEAARLKTAGNVEAATTLENDLLFEIRQRRQDILTQLAVAVQGYMAMELVRKNNNELVKGVDRAKTTTIFALKTAVIVSQALDTQKLVLDQIDAVNETTNRTIEQTSQLLRQQTARVHEQAASSTVAVATLERAFDNIFATLDEIETFKQRANESMAETITSLEHQLADAKPRLDRVRAQEVNQTGK
ncbi:toxic anion resistance protein [Pseudoclavibacter sp. CFCC 13611]|uniref:toxic anion resistance protein n=1 Tax=Pseudoclavibacter sp. CFCC 13611 TaxID=2615178 RepID=UPI001301206A|nr:toxic anion resistance protein [Pseudoclavibacter sp. CFCC 13611]KAB1662642.1 toxic anion resistance protein [Pseudoclavibacter sp. CFCC 13611]